MEATSGCRPEQLPVLGNLLQIGSRPHRYFQAVARRYGPVVEVRLGRVRTVVVSSPEAAKELLRSPDQRPALLHPPKLARSMDAHSCLPLPIELLNWPRPAI